MSDRRDMVIPSDLSEVPRIQQDIEELLSACAFCDRDVFFIRLCVEEAIVNAIKHGNQLDPDKSVKIWYRINSEHFSIQIEDEGGGFDPGDLPDPTDPENIDKPCGRGVHLIRSFMTRVEFTGRGNIISMTKTRNGESN